jgi:glycosyltransferase involved in cell wall biosynthesis
MALSRALKQTYGSDVALYFVQRDVLFRSYKEVAEVGGQIIRINSSSEWTPKFAVEYAMSTLLSHDLVGSRALEENKIDVLFGLLLRNRYRMPTLSWIPDFQHIHLPQMFSAEERRQRDRTFLKTARISGRVIVMSESVKRDFKRFAPQYLHKVRVLPAVSFPPETVYEREPLSVLALYHLPEKFAYFPGQFWKHKNHDLVFKALALLKEKGVKVFVVCDGSPEDYRDRRHFADLLTSMSTLGIRSQVALICSPNQEHVFSLMRQAVCVLNASLFEGFGLTINEAMCLGKRVLLSDIDAHREQNPPKATYFDPNNCKDLASKLDRVWNETDPGPDLQLEKQARQELSRRSRVSAESLMSVLREVTSH